MKKLIPVAFFALLALNSNAIKAATSTSPTTVAETSIPNEKRAGETESTNLNKVKDSSEKEIKGSESITKSNDSTTMNSKDGAGIYISSGAALIIIVILLIILL